MARPCRPLWNPAPQRVVTSSPRKASARAIARFASHRSPASRLRSCSPSWRKTRTGLRGTRRIMAGELWPPATPLSPWAMLVKLPIQDTTWRNASGRSHAAVLKDHRAGRLVAGPLGGDVPPPDAGRPGEGLAAPVQVGVQDSARDVGAWAAVRVCRVDLEPVADAALRLRLFRLLVEGALRQQRAAAAARDLVAPAEGGAGRQRSAAGEGAGLVQAAERQRESAIVRRHPYRVRVGAFQRPDRRQLVDERLGTGLQRLGGKAGAEVRRERGAVGGSAVGLQRERDEARR